MFDPGSTLPICAVQQVGRCLAYTGRDASGGATAARAGCRAARKLYELPNSVACPRPSAARGKPTVRGMVITGEIGPNLPPTVHRSSPPRPFRNGYDSSASSENRQRIERRSCSFFDAQRRSREQKLETIKPPRLLDRSLEIEIIENVYAHRDQRQPMQRIWDRWRQTCGHDVVWPVASDEGNAPLFQEIRNVGVISGEPGFPWPGAERGAPLPTPRIEKDDVACRHRHVFHLL